MKIIKQSFLASILFFSSIFCTSDPLLVVVLMVKNEQDVIVPTLKPFVDGGVDSFLIFDTGSTDNTIQNATEYLETHNVRFFIAQEPFIDFATSRNRGLDIARDKFPDAAFLTMPDAEWYIEHADELLEFCKVHKNDTESAYLLHIVSSDLDFYTARLIRANAPVRFVGEVHEVIDYLATIKVPAHIKFQLSPSHYGIEKSRKRWERDLKIFERKFAESPFDTRNLFYYGQTLWCLNELEKAYEIYALRAGLRGWDEEDYLSWYRLARITEQLASQNSNYSWSQAMEYYLKAYTLRPSRAEPIIRIALHYLNEDNHAVGYLFALRASQAPYPTNDILMVEKELYEYMRHEILCRCAWYIGEFEVGFSAACKAKQLKPELPHVQRNAQLFFDKLCESPLITH